MNKLIIFIFFILLITPLNVFAQACCSAGTPLLSSLELTSIPEGSWQFGVSYEYNKLDDVLAGSDKLDDNTRQRTSNSTLLEISYGLSRSFSLSALFSIIQQERKITSLSDYGAAGLLKTRGIGDVIALVKYNIVPLNFNTQREIAIGFGGKLPVGKSDLKSNGIIVPADMQPGTGAWDGILWGYLYQGFLPATRLNFFATTSYRYTGTNERDYRFGNEFVLSMTTSYRTDYFFDFTLTTRFRNVAVDQFQNNGITNTGGKWLYLVPGVNVNFYKNFSFRVTSEIPVYRNLNGTQLTTSYKFFVSLFYNLTGSKYKFN